MFSKKLVAALVSLLALEQGAFAAGNLCQETAGVKIHAETYTENGFPEFMVDGKPGTYWHSGKRATPIVVEFPAPVEVSQSYWFHGGCEPGTIDERGLKDYDITTSVDGRSWEKAVTVRNYKGGAKHDNFTARKAKFVKLELLDTQGFLLPVICEWELRQKAQPVPSAETNCPPMPDSAELTLAVDIFTDKMLYPVGGDVKVNVTVRNKRVRAGDFTVDLLESTGVGEPELIHSEALKVGQWASGNFEHTLKKVTKEYGHRLLAVVKEKGAELSRSDTVFEVTDHWAKLARYNLDTGHEKLSPGLSQAEVDLHAAMLRELYVNSVELFGQHYRFSQHYTDKQEWASDERGTMARMTSAQTTMMWTGTYDDNGIKTVGYTETGALSPDLDFRTRHPDWIIHGPLSIPEDRRKLYALPMYFRDFNQGTFPAGKPIAAPDLHYNDAGNLYAMTEYLADDWGKAAKRFGWRGAFFDSFAWALEDSAFGHNQRGGAMNTATPDEIGSRLLAAIKKEVKATTGEDFVPVCNFGVPAGVSPWRERNPDFAAFRKSSAVYQKTLKEMGILFLEQHPASHLGLKDQWGRFVYPQTIEETVLALRWIREANDVNVPVMLMPLEFTRNLHSSAVDANLLFSACYAGGVLVCLSEGTLPRALLSGPLRENPKLAVVAAYNKFAARYGEYLFDLDNRLLAKDLVQCDAPANVWWKELVSCRKRDNGDMNVYVHLVNRPKSPMAWGETLDAPPPLRGVGVRVQVPDGMEIRGVWAVSPKGDQNPERLAWTSASNVASVTAPELFYWTMLVVEMRKQDGRK